jgi:carbon monoxide dehydrogenase subunit G
MDYQRGLTVAVQQIHLLFQQKCFLFRCFTVLLLVLLFSFFADGWADAPIQPPRVAIVQDAGSLKTLQAEALVDAPIDTVWEALSDYPNLKKLFPGYERSTVLQSSGDTTTVDLQLRPSGLLRPFRYQVRIREDKAAYTLNIQRISGDFRMIEASYRLIPVEGGSRTRVLYHLSIDLGNLPTLGTSGILKGGTARAMASIQSHCADVYRRMLTVQAVR